MSTRPSRNAPPPPSAANALYCHTCGRIITPRKLNPPTTPSTPQKYCSDRCRRSKPRPDTNSSGPSLEKLIESTFVRLLGVGDGSERRIVECGEVEKEVFGGRDGAGGRGVEEGEREADVDVGDEEHEDDDDDDEDGGVPLPSSSSSSSTTTSTTAATSTAQGKGLSSQQRGVRRAKEREMVRQAGRRGVAFGFEIESGGARRKVDCVRGGRVVESSFAKGEWGVRWKV